MDMSLFSKKKEFPSQTENRKQWILDTIKANQSDVASILFSLHWKKWKGGDCYTNARHILEGMYPQDRDALLLPGGILTDEQILKLTGEDNEESNEV